LFGEDGDAFALFPTLYIASLRYIFENKDGLIA